MTQCPIHHVDWKTVPAGFSAKTGKAYNSFLACPVQGCSQRPPRAPQAPNGSAQVQSTSASSDVLAAACLGFAGELYRGAGAELADDAIALALRAYSAFKAVQP